MMGALKVTQVAQIRDVITEMLQGDRAKLAPLAERIARANLLTKRIRSGELARFDDEFPRCGSSQTADSSDCSLGSLAPWDAGFAVVTP
jgi:hypothetical protein